MLLEDVRRCFDDYNRRFFRGRLPAIPIRIERLNGAEADCQRPGWRGYPSGLIRLSPGLLRGPRWRGTLLHEMIHAWLDLQDVDEWETGKVAWHGPRFTRECNRIGARLGLPEVSVEDSWAWPCVLFSAEEWEPSSDDADSEA